MNIDVRIRWMIRRDRPEVLEIENQCFEFPWTEEDFIRVLRQRNCIGMIAEYKCRVIGAMIYELHKAHLHVLNFAVHPKFQGKGVGRQMVKKLTDKLSGEGRNRIVLNVREVNLSAQKFFARMGFRATEILPEFFCNDEAAYRMEYRLSWPAPPTHIIAKQVAQKLHREGIERTPAQLILLAAKHCNGTPEQIGLVLGHWDRGIETLAEHLQGEVSHG